MGEATDIQAVLFDLDGTLADSAVDLGYALNLVLAEQGRPALPMDAIRPFASYGAKGLIGLGFGITPEDEAFPALRDRFLDLYEANVCHGTQLFPGMETVLDALEARGIKWGIVTNKFARFTDPLMEKMALNGRAGCVVSGDTCALPKPDPASLLLAAERLGVAPAHCLYVGDHERDVQAALNAGMRPVAALYGYLNAQDRPEEWGAMAMIRHPEDLLNHV